MRKKQLTDKLQKRRAATKSDASAPDIRSTVKNAEEYENMLSEDMSHREQQEEKKLKRKKRLYKAVQICLVACCLYLAFLTYGVINTDFIYDETGAIVPRVMTIERIQQLDSYNRLLVQYRQARYLYEQVLTLDYRMAAEIEEPLTIAPEYEKLLTSVEPLAIQLSALEVPAEYTQVKNMLLAWTQNDIAIYCQSMSKAISQNNSADADKALQYKSLMYQDFSVITQNIITLGQQVDDADIGDLQKWSPETYIQDTFGAYASGN